MSRTAGPSHPQRFFRNFVALSGPYWSGRAQWRPRLMTLSLAIIGIGQVALAIRLNVWTADLFDALERRSTDSAMAQIGIFALIILGVMSANTAHMVIHRHLQLDWRRWLTARVIGDWMEDARHYQANLIPGDHANPDGRIAEDIRIATEASIELATSLFYCVLLLITFVGILWSLSGWIRVMDVGLPGHLVALAFGYAGMGAVIAFFLGRPLVRATDTRQTREANFRFGLVRAHENAEPIAIARGEGMERRRLATTFEAIAQSWRDQSMGLARLLAFSSGYVALAAVLPILVGTPRFLEGALSLGRLMQSGLAFQQVTAALSWPVDNLARIAEWRASVERVLLLDEAIRVVALEAARTGETAINLDRASTSQLGVRDLWVAAPDGTAMLSGLTLEVSPGEHVLVDGDPEAASALFRVLAGIWPWGRGRVDLPADADMVAVGQRPFLPEGSLRRAIAFSEQSAPHSHADLRAALDSVGLGYLVDRLDEPADWGRSLSAAELQCLSFARLLLLRPDWIVLGDATDALEPAVADLMLGLLVERLPGSGIVLIGRHPGSAGNFSRRLTLTRAADGEVLLHEVHARRQAAMAPRAQPLPVVDLLREGYGR
ncbi:ABC transporter ATP-binding protein/permease [Roseomonas sp. PWR1]|uniref:ABC transporter ATP-binding protein/permease n=1 Tax=Roseomonas nitratireducens TaxID=2820810 RepID=A0ABS4B0H4_9PROT|nr:ABC transporter ATP-binding protein/permease [Neoroseomonas nitratireducens]MBP0466541.1 ABC transporter ATP-binding protein/permease [Neoroseomonas nitratireducens]